MVEMFVEDKRFDKEEIERGSRLYHLKLILSNSLR